MDIIFIALLSIHIIAGTAWVGFAMFFEIVVEQHKRQVLLLHIGPRLGRYLAIASTMTIIAGALLIVYGYLFYNMSIFGNGASTLVIGGLLGAIAWLLGIYLGLLSPRLNGQKAGPVQSQTIGRMRIVGRIELALLIITIIFMVLGSNI